MMNNIIDQQARTMGTIYGKKARFHGATCRDGFKTDRQYGAIYNSYIEDDGRPISVEQASLAWGFCAYCGLPNG
jgi:hypothetical protein